VRGTSTEHIADGATRAVLLAVGIWQPSVVLVWQVLIFQKLTLVAAFASEIGTSMGQCTEDAMLGVQHAMETLQQTASRVLQEVTYLRSTQVASLV